MRIKVNDLVEVIVGDDKGTRAKVLSVDHATGKIVVEGVNRVYKHMRKSQKNPQGGRLSKEMPIQAANVMLVCPKTGQKTRVGVRRLPDGSRERFCLASGASAGVIKSAKKKAKA